MIFRTSSDVDMVVVATNFIIVINDRQYKRRRTVDQTQGTRDFNMENPPKVEGKNHGHQLANLHYIG